MPLGDVERDAVAGKLANAEGVLDNTIKHEGGYGVAVTAGVSMGAPICDNEEY